MTGSNVAQDQIKAYVDRILRMKEEADAIAADIREIYAEAKANGFDKTQLGNLVTYLRKKDKDAEKVAEGEAIFDLYLTAYLGASGKAGTKPATHTYAPDRPDALAALRANPGMHIVSASQIKPKSEPQPLTQAGSDLTTPQALNGQVATHSDIGNPISTEARDEVGHVAADAPDQGLVDAGNSADNRNPGGENVDAPDVPATQTPQDVTDKSVGAAASAAPVKYAAPGVITWEIAPPEGVKRGAVSTAFGNIGQDAVLIKDDLASGRAQPIVKIGNEIIDGFCRFMTARGMTQSVLRDGVPTEEPLPYAVMQYAGDDPLIDAIKLNVEGRVLSEREKLIVAKRLADRPEFKARKDDIYKAFEIWMEPV